MREIEFRGKRIDTGEWVYGGFTFDAINNLRITVKYNGGLLFPEVTPETIGQYTGLKDRNGVRIFEGDIVKRIIVHNEDSIICFVEYCDCSFVMRHKKILYAYETLKRLNEAVKDEIFKFEVIGNIHDNPELLEGSND